MEFTAGEVPHQLILFGPPGTSKSHTARHVLAVALGVEDDDVFPVTFHPEFGYGDFVARLMPMTRAEGGTRRIEYNIHAGPFIKALARAYAAPDKKILLLIDEINRGNCAEIFGDVFQLLDRDDDAWSSYEVMASEIVMEALRDTFDGAASGDGSVAAVYEKKKLRLPPNLHLVGTMNSSDESVYFMDTAFKRRWHFQFVPVDFSTVPATQKAALLENGSAPAPDWETFLTALNRFIVAKCQAAKLDDKLVGPWFIKARSAGRLADKYPVDLDALKTLAPKVTIYHKGADYSRQFDELFDQFVARLDAGPRAAVLDFAGYDAGSTRRIGKIPFEPSSHYYYARKTEPSTMESGQLVIEAFVAALGQLPLAPRISRHDIAGKLCLYLWDNVFDRDRRPLYEVIGCGREALRTFGDFAGKVDAFVDGILRDYGGRPEAVATTASNDEDGEAETAIDA
ncbi:MULTISPECIES: McrB family protein [Cupriavidus]